MTTRLAPGQNPTTRPHGGRDHAWYVESAHRTSAGEVLYVRCAHCHTRRVDVREHRAVPPSPLSREIGGD